jgi:hypothetical protein
MTIKTNREHQELEADGDDELTLVAVTYTGDQSVYNASATRQQGGWPARSPFNSGVTEVALVPSKRLGFWERHADFEIAYDDESLAAALLEKNYLAPQVFGANVDIDLRDRVLDTLGIDVKRNAEAYREALADVAGPDADAGEEADPHETRQSDFADAKRSTLQRAAEAHGKSDVDSAGREELADYLAEQDDDDVDATIDSIQSGDGVPDDSGSGGTASEAESFEDLDGVGEARADDLRDAGYETIGDLRDAGASELADIDGVSESLAASITDQVGGGGGE